MQVKVIAEPWDCGGLYQVGGFPNWDVWGEWNGKYRDDVRRFIKGDGGMKAAFATRLAGSADLYHVNQRYAISQSMTFCVPGGIEDIHHGGSVCGFGQRVSGWQAAEPCCGVCRKPTDGVNFIIAHDGFTLYDLVAYNEKHNDANGEGNRDGSNDNFSWNCGAEGETGDEGVNALRQRQMRNLHLALAVSQGMPMVLMGARQKTQQFKRQKSHGSLYHNSRRQCACHACTAEKELHCMNSISICPGNVETHGIWVSNKQQRGVLCRR